MVITAACTNFAVTVPVVPILDSVVAADAVAVVVFSEAAGNLGPFRANLPDLDHDVVALGRRNGTMVEAGTQVLDPAFTALLGGAAAHAPGDGGPVLAQDFDEVAELIVLGIGPRALYRVPSSSGGSRHGGGCVVCEAVVTMRRGEDVVRCLR